MRTKVRVRGRVRARARARARVRARVRARARVEVRSGQEKVGGWPTASLIITQPVADAGGRFRWPIHRTWAFCRQVRLPPASPEPLAVYEPMKS